LPSRRQVTKPRRKSTSIRRELVESQILDQAAELFARQGFSATSLQEVADALKINRTALYYYVNGKQDLLTMLVEGVSRDTANSLGRIAEDRSLAPIVKLRDAIKGMALRIASNAARFRLLLMSEGALDGALATEHHNSRRRTLQALTRILEEGMQTGEIRPIDPHLAAFAILGMCNWIAWWYRPDRVPNQTPELIAESMADIGLSALRPFDDRSSASGGNSVERAISSLRRDLAYLEQSVQESNTVEASQSKPKPPRKKKA
jgi:AcrR family transcriptional regulator